MPPKAFTFARSHLSPLDRGLDRFRSGSDCRTCKSMIFAGMSPEEIDRGQPLRSWVRRFPPKTQIHMEGSSCHEISVLCTGWAFLYKTLFDGSRQILDFALPGSLIGFPLAESVDYLDHAVETITDLSLCVFATQTILKEVRSNSVFASCIIWGKTRDKARAYEHLIDLGRRSARERVAHLLLELFTRLGKRHAVTGMTCEFPLTQSHLADALGLSTVHVNRVLRQLREEGLARVSGQRLTILDLETMEEICDYDDSYLLSDSREYRLESHG